MSRVRIGTVYIHDADGLSAESGLHGDSSWVTLNFGDTKITVFLPSEAIAQAYATAINSVQS